MDTVLYNEASESYIIIAQPIEIDHVICEILNWVAATVSQKKMTVVLLC